MDQTKEENRTFGTVGVKTVLQKVEPYLVSMMTQTIFGSRAFSMDRVVVTNQMIALPVPVWNPWVELSVIHRAAGLPEELSLEELEAVLRGNLHMVVLSDCALYPEGSIVEKDVIIDPAFQVEIGTGAYVIARYAKEHSHKNTIPGIISYIPVIRPFSASAVFLEKLSQNYERLECYAGRLRMMQSTGVPQVILESEAHMLQEYVLAILDAEFCKESVKQTEDGQTLPCWFDFLGSTQDEVVV